MHCQLFLKRSPAVSNSTSPPSVEFVPLYIPETILRKLLRNACSYSLNFQIFYKACLIILFNCAGDVYIGGTKLRYLGS
jgi:hypothetical protein